ncbi:sigma-70 family RNA polymerase sigma factor [Streptomyces triticirhizae]|uniref:Sigma-70 family RNA polymerase sigma factor n=2 Tax=Streptomyces triticirhizae TaxID=2483353 RepID=A0A3M2LPV4_9ACTN|nr:sigma-70 family RNA polymerase sigma factor [Streptomyces triticirhizae]
MSEYTGWEADGPWPEEDPGGEGLDGLPLDERLEAMARAFEAERPRLLRVAYTTTGSLAESEDCVQEAWIRLRGTLGRTEIHDLRGWLVTTVGRLALDALGSAKARRESYVGTWLPEPVVEDDPAEQVTLDESVSLALLVVLEQLSPAERTAFVLHDVFGVSFAEVAEIVGRTPAAVRQLASRARRHVADGRPRFPPTPAQQRALVAAFADACQRGDLAGLVELLDPDVAWRGDGGGRVTTTARTQYGAMRVAKGILLALSGASGLTMRLATVNGVPGLVVYEHEGDVSVVSFDMDEGRITSIDVVRNPEKLNSVVRLERDGSRLFPDRE